MNVKSTINDLALKVDEVWQKDNNTILAAGSVVLTAGSIVLACVGQHKADVKIANTEKRIGRKLTFKEKLFSVWYYYIPAALTGAAAGTCAIESNSICVAKCTEKVASAAAVATVAENTTKLVEKENAILKEKLGKTTIDKAESKSSQDLLKERNVKERSEKIKGEGELFYDPLLDRVFRADPAKVDYWKEQTLIDIGEWNSVTRRGGENWVGYNTFWQNAAGLDSAEIMDDYGFTRNHPIDFMRHAEYLDAENDMDLCHVIYWRDFPHHDEDHNKFGDT